jgi:hypothetical protein
MFAASAIFQTPSLSLAPAKKPDAGRRADDVADEDEAGVVHVNHRCFPRLTIAVIGILFAPW